MSDLRELYQTTILDHGRKPRNFGKLETANRQAEGYNPLCGDQLTLYLEVEDGVVKRAGFEGSGCAISTASASLLTEAVQGRTVEEVMALFERFHQLVAGEVEVDPLAGRDAGLGKLSVFSGVREFPMRVKCATLAWHAMRSALAGEGGTVKTE
jgi:nitrogen fixation NifU-like protein